MIFIKQIFRARVQLIAFLLLLSLSGAVLCTGVNAYVDVNRQAKEIQERYTTMAIPTYALPELLEEYNGSSWIKEIQTARKNLVKEAIEAAAQSQYIRFVDERNLISAYIHGTEPLILKELEWPAPHSNIFDASYQMGIFVVTCKGLYKGLDESSTGIYEYQNTITINGTTKSYWKKYYEMQMELDEIISLNSAYNDVKELKLETFVLEEDGEIFFEEGKRYILWGRISSPVMINMNQEEEQWRAVGNYGLSLMCNNGEYYYFPYDEDDVPYYEIIEVKGKEYINIKSREDYPVCAELQEDETLEEFLASDRGTPWRENILPLCETNRQSVPVITTEWLESMLLFNISEAGMMEGRSFSQKEYEESANVCVISAAYAEKNGLEVGDTLWMQLYDTGYIKEDALLFTEEALEDKSIKSIYSQNRYTYYQMNEYRMDVPLQEAEEYTIVGIYQSSGFNLGAYNFSPNTIFIPGNRMNMLRYPDNVTDTDSDILVTPKADNMDILTSFVLENGTLEDFQAEMKALGYGDCFLYFDQGYEVTEGAGTEAMKVNAQRLLLFGVLLFVTASVLTVFLYCRWGWHSVWILRLTGMSKKKVLLEAMSGLLGMSGIGLVLSGFLGGMLFQVIHKVVFISMPTGSFSFEATIGILLVEFGFMVIIGMGFIARTILRPLMGSRNEL